MSVSRSIYESNVDTRIPNNTTRDITPAIDRTDRKELANAALFFEDDYLYYTKNTTASGTDTYTIAETIPAAYTAGERFYVTFTNANTGTSTLDRNSLGAKALLYNDGTNLSSGALKAGGTYLVFYNGTNYVVIGLATSGTTLASGVYTPTLTGVTNVSSTTAAQCQYLRVGNSVTVSGVFDVQATSSAADTTVGISLPVSSNISQVWHCCGTGCSQETSLAYNSAIIFGDATNDRASLKFYSTTTSTRSFYFTFTYKIA